MPRLWKPSGTELNWTDESDIVELKGRYNVAFGNYIRWKMMFIDSKLSRQAYKESILDSQNKVQSFCHHEG